MSFHPLFSQGNNTQQNQELESHEMQRQRLQMQAQHDVDVVDNSFSDHSTEHSESQYYSPPLKFLSLERQPAKGGVSVPFPLKLHEMLDQIEADGLAEVISWQPHGRCFVVHDPKRFSDSVMPTYFRQTKFASFQRQLNLYGFSRLTSGRDKGGYFHELFLKGKSFLCHRMQRLKIKGTGVRKAASPETEPQFYAMSYVKAGNSSYDKSNDHQHLHVTEPLSLWSNINDNRTPLSNLFLQQRNQQQLQTNDPSPQLPQAALMPPPQHQQQDTNFDYTQVYTLPQLMQVQQQLPQIPNMLDWVKVLHQQQAQIATMQQQLAMHQSQPQPLIVQVQHMQPTAQQQYEVPQRHEQESEHLKRQTPSKQQDQDKEFHSILAALCKMPVESQCNKSTPSLLENESLASLFEMLTE